MKRILILGGYGTFGSFISQRLAIEKDVQLVIAGRSLKKARAFAENLTATNRVEAVSLDIHQDLAGNLAKIEPDIVLHTSGPFQDQSPDVAWTCINQGCHYIDLADAKTFVTNISQLDQAAKQANLLVVSGASSVPCLTSGLVDHYLPEFKDLQTLDYGITTAQQTGRGLATTAAILSYTGKPFDSLIKGRRQILHGWQGLTRHVYPQLGGRFLGNCDIPDLDLFPSRYPTLKTIRFQAGLELPILHLGLWLISWGVRFKLIRNLEKAAPFFLRLSDLFDFFGSKDSGFHMTLRGIDQKEQAKAIHFSLIARSGDGPNIPCIPSILLALKLARGEISQRGATACMGLITLQEYLNALSELDITWHTEIL